MASPSMAGVHEWSLNGEHHGAEDQLESRNTLAAAASMYFEKVKTMHTHIKIKHKRTAYPFDQPKRRWVFLPPLPLEAVQVNATGSHRHCHNAKVHENQETCEHSGICYKNCPQSCCLPPHPFIAACPRFLVWRKPSQRPLHPDQLDAVEVG